MYTIMLMTSLSTAPDVAEFNGFFRDLFNRGGCQGSCTGTSNRNASCNGSCNGNFLGIVDRMRSFFRGNSCNGTSRSQGCYASSSCMGSSYGCFGSTYNSDGTWVDPYNPYGSPGVYSDPLPPNVIPYESSPRGEFTPIPGNVEPAQPAPAIPPPSVPDRPNGQGISQFSTQSIQATPDRAEVEVLLPADAILYAESERLKLTSNRRVFVSPPLTKGQRYEYSFQRGVCPQRRDDQPIAECSDSSRFPRADRLC